MSSGPFPTQTELMVMMILRDGEARYGFEIMRETKVKRGTVYVLLNRLVERKLIAVVKRTKGHPGMDRPHYGLTATGRKVLDAYRKIFEFVEG